MGQAMAIQKGVDAGFGIAQAIWGRGGGGAARADYERSKKAQDELQNIYNYTMPLAKSEAASGTAATKTGMGTLDQVKQYWTGILSGSRPAQLAAAEPEISAANEMAAARRGTESAYGTGRGGGANVAAQEAETQRMTDISKALFAARGPAATGLAATGEAQAQIGLQQMANALRGIGLSEQAVAEIVRTAQAARDQSAAINKNTWRNIGQAVGASQSAIGEASGGGGGGSSGIMSSFTSGGGFGGGG